MTLGQLINDVKFYGSVAVFRDNAIEGVEEFSCTSEELEKEAIGNENDDSLLECKVLSMFAQELGDGTLCLCIGLDWDGDEY